MNIAPYIGRTIAEAAITDNALTLRFSDGSAIKMFDDGQSCCEHRYMSSDDDVSSLVGGKLLRAEVKDSNGVWNSYGTEDEDNGFVSECAFLEVATDKGFVTVANHNDHNGYYGGFRLKADPLN